MEKKFLSGVRSKRKASSGLKKVEDTIPQSLSREAAKLSRRRDKGIMKKGLNSKKEKDLVVVKAPLLKRASIRRNGSQDKKSRIYSDPSTVKQVSTILPNEFEDEKMQDKQTGFFKQLDFTEHDLMDYKSAASIAKDCSSDVFPVNKLPGIPKHHGNDVDSTCNSESTFANKKSQDKPTGGFENLDFPDVDAVGYKSAASIAKDCSADVFIVNKHPEIPQHHGKDVGSRHNNVHSFADEKMQDKIEEAMRLQVMTELKQELVERKIRIDQQLAETRKDLEELEQKIAEMKLQEEFDNWSFVQSMDDESTKEGTVALSFDNGPEKETLKIDRLLKVGACLEGGTSMEASESLEGGASMEGSESWDNSTAMGTGTSSEKSVALMDSVSSEDSESFEFNTVESTLDKISMCSGSMEVIWEEEEEEEKEEEEMEAASLSSESVFNQMLVCGDLEEAVLCLDVSRRVRFTGVDEICGENEYESYDEENEYSDDESPDDEIDDEHKVDGSVCSSAAVSQNLIRLEEMEAREEDYDALNKDSSLLGPFGETKGMGFSDAEDEGSNQGNPFQSSDESPSKTDHQAINQMKVWKSGMENTLPLEGNGPKQSTVHAKPVTDEGNKQCFLAAESTQGFPDYWQRQSMENTETREDQSVARNGTERIARVIMEGRAVTTGEHMELARAFIDEGDSNHCSPQISAEFSIDMWATIPSNDSMLKATQEWETFGSSPFENSPFGTSSPFYDSCPSDEFL